MYGDKMEMSLIQKMAKLANEYVEPYDDMDRSPEVQRNYARKIEYDIYKDLLLEIWEKK